MKRFFIMFAFISSTIFTSSYAAAPTATPAAVVAFQTAFHGAKNIAWNQVGVLYKASFELNGEHRAAFYNGDGDLIATTQHLASTGLPTSLQNSLKAEMKAGWITELFVVTIEGSNTYYVKLENADTVVMLKSNGSKKWSLYQKNEKE